MNFEYICVTVIKIALEANSCDVQKSLSISKKAHISISTVIDLSELCVLTAAWHHRVVNIFEEKRRVEKNPMRVWQ